MDWTERDPNAALAAPADTALCRELLAALLRRAWPHEAAAWAETLIAEFGSLPAVLAAGARAPARRIGAEPARFLADVRMALLHCLRLPLAERPIISTSRQLLDYLQADMTNLINERFRVLFLTSQNELLADDLVWEGTVGEAPAYPREIVKRALEVGATGLILVHNHPSGNHEPSRGDGARAVVRADRERCGQRAEFGDQGPRPGVGLGGPARPEERVQDGSAPFRISRRRWPCVPIAISSRIG
jgi:DNA repair protein RadC